MDTLQIRLEVGIWGDESTIEVEGILKTMMDLKGPSHLLCLGEDLSRLETLLDPMLPSQPRGMPEQLIGEQYQNMQLL